MISRIAIIFSLVLATTALTTAEDEKKPVDAAGVKKQSLDWIDKYAKGQVLFHQQDIDRVRKDLAEGSDQEALQWWKGTAEIRAILESPEWKDTQAWLKEFLKVQAIYSDKEVDEFRTEAEETAKTHSAEDFKKILTDVAEYRRRLAKGSANARELREQQLKVVEAFRQKEAAARHAALVQASKTSPPNTVQQPVRPRAPRQSPAPLINSLDVARWSVMRNFWHW